MANFLILVLALAPHALSDVSKQLKDLVTTARLVFLALGHPARPVQVDSDNQTVEPATVCHAFQVSTRISSGAQNVALAHRVNFKDKKMPQNVTLAQQVGTRQKVLVTYCVSSVLPESIKTKRSKCDVTYAPPDCLQTRLDVITAKSAQQDLQQRKLKVQVALSVVSERSNKQKEKKHAYLAQVGNLQTSLQCRLSATTAQWDLLRQAKRTLSVFPAVWENFKVLLDKAHVHLVRQDGCRKEWAKRHVR